MEPLGNLNKVLPYAPPVAYPLMHHLHAQVCTRTAISYFNISSFPKSIPLSRTLPWGGPSWAYSPYLPLESEGREKENESLATQAFMHARVCSNHPITPLIILQSSNRSLYTMFALLRCAITMTRDKQCACCIRSKQDLYVYTFFFVLILIFTNSSFCRAPRSKRGIPTLIIYCVSRHFLIVT